MKDRHHYFLDSSYQSEEFGPSVISLQHDYLWVGSDHSCWGHLSSLRQLRKIHTRLGEIIHERSRKRAGRTDGRKLKRKPLRQIASQEIYAPVRAAKAALAGRSK